MPLNSLGYSFWHGFLDKPSGKAERTRLSFRETLPLRSQPCLFIKKPCESVPNILTIEFDEFLEGAEGGAGVDRLAGDGDALFDALLTPLQYLNTEGGIGQYDVLLGG